VQTAMQGMSDFPEICYLLIYFYNSRVIFIYIYYI